MMLNCYIINKINIYIYNIISNALNVVILFNDWLFVK